MDILTVLAVVFFLYCVFSGDWKQVLWRILVFILFCAELYFSIDFFLDGYQIVYLVLGFITSYLIGYIMINIFTAKPEDLDEYPDPSFLDSANTHAYRGPALFLFIGIVNVPLYMLVTILWQGSFRK